MSIDNFIKSHNSNEKNFFALLPQENIKAIVNCIKEWNQSEPLNLPQSDDTVSLSLNFQIKILHELEFLEGSLDDARSLKESIKKHLPKLEALLEFIKYYNPIEPNNHTTKIIIDLITENFTDEFLKNKDKLSYIQSLWRLSDEKWWLYKIKIPLSLKDEIILIKLQLFILLHISHWSHILLFIIKKVNQANFFQQNLLNHLETHKNFIAEKREILVRKHKWRSLSQYPYKSYDKRKFDERWGELFHTYSHIGITINLDNQCITFKNTSFSFESIKNINNINTQNINMALKFIYATIKQWHECTTPNKDNFNSLLKEFAIITNIWKGWRNWDNPNYENNSLKSYLNTANQILVHITSNKLHMRLAPNIPALNRWPLPHT